MTTVPLSQSVTIRLDGSGGGTAKVGPLSAREVWHPQNAAVSANSSPIVEAQCQIFVGDSNTKRFRDSTVNGSTGDSTGKISSDTVRCGEYVWAVWSGGDALQYATLTVTGSKDV